MLKKPSACNEEGLELPATPSRGFRLRGPEPLHDFLERPGPMLTLQSRDE